MFNDKKIFTKHTKEIVFSDIMLSVEDKYNFLKHKQNNASRTQQEFS